MDQRAVVLITGANTGLGLEMVRALCGSDKSYEIFVGGRSLVKAEQATNSITKDFPSTRSMLWPVQVDIEDDESIQRVFDHVQTKFSRLDALVNNAGENVDEYFQQCPLTHFRCPIRSTNPNRKDDDAPSMERFLERQHRRHSDHDSHLCTSPTQIP